MPGQSRLKPLHSDFEDAGTIDALHRLYTGIAAEYAEAPPLPSWVTATRLDFLIGTESELGEQGGDHLRLQAEKLIPLFSQLEARLLRDAERIAPTHLARARSAPQKPTGKSPTGKSTNGKLPTGKSPIGKSTGNPMDKRMERPKTTGPAGHPSSFQDEVDSPQGGDVHRVCLARLLFGACCEAFAIVACSRISPFGCRPTSTLFNADLKRLYKDSCHAAAWTSAHAHYLDDIVATGMSIVRPSLHSIKSELNEPDLSDLFSRRLAGKHGIPSAATAMLAFLTRCTNPGSRGWDSILKTSLEDSDGARRLSAEALTVSLTGMHSCIHPGARLHWKQRLGLMLHLSEQSLFKSVVLLAKHPLAFKELIRRMCSNTVSSSFASNDALEQLEHPVALLAGNVQRLCPDGLERSSMTFVSVGTELVHHRGEISLEEALCKMLTFKNSEPVASSSKDQRALQWNAAYLGKGSACIHNKVPAVNVASTIFSFAFRRNFLPFWVHCSSHDQRAPRLGDAQYNALHEMNAATQLTLQLDANEQLQVQRAALSRPSSGLMTLEDVGKLFGLVGVRGASCNGGSKGIKDAVRTISAGGARGAAQILHFCRTAAISEDILVYDLGPRSYRLQLEAVVKRSLTDELVSNGTMTLDQLLEHVPQHTKCLCACVECKRVSNAVATDGGSKWNVSFNEIGTSGSMISTDALSNESHLRCAKRCSTSLKTAIANEEEMNVCNIECMDIKQDALRSMLHCGGETSANGVCARARRDCKSAFEQRESCVPCGGEKMLAIPIIGKAIRLWDQWYALCSFCGCFINVRPNNKFESELCCLRCDHDMLNRHNKVDKKKFAQPSNAPVCRYCGKVHRESHHLSLICRNPTPTKVHTAWLG